MEGSGNSTNQRSTKQARALRAFTLLELLATIAILGVLLLLMAPSTASLLAARSASAAACEMAGILDQARAYAIANHTHVFVGILEENAATPPPAPAPRQGIGRVIMGSFASCDGTRGYDNQSDPRLSWQARYRNGANLRLLGTLRVWENLHVAASLGAPPKEGSMARPEVNYYYRLGHSSCRSVTPIVWPLGRSLNEGREGGEYYFEKVIRFDPSGIPRIQYRTNADTVVQWMEIGLQQTRGNSWGGGNQTAILIDGITGALRIYRNM